MVVLKNGSSGSLVEPKRRREMKIMSKRPLTNPTPSNLDFF